MMSQIGRIPIIVAAILLVVCLGLGISQAVSVNSDSKDVVGGESNSGYSTVHTDGPSAKAARIIQAPAPSGSFNLTNFHPYRRSTTLVPELRNSSMPIGQQLNLVDMSKVGSRFGVQNSAETPQAGVDIGVTSGKTPSSETEILLRKLANEILVKLFDKFILKAAEANSRVVVAGRNTARDSNPSNGMSMAAPNTDMAAPNTDTVIPKFNSLTRRIPNVNTLPLNRPRINAGSIQRSRPILRLVKSNMVSGARPSTASPSLTNQSPLATGATTSPLTPMEMFRRYYRRRMEMEGLEEMGIGPFGMMDA